MISYYGYTISPNQLETGEGFLICRNVPIARTGAQDYRGDEVGKPGEAVVKVIRPEEEVFSPAAIASFEGKPFTDDHPPVLLNPDNVSAYEKGHVQNVRRGSGEFSDFLLADIHIHDAATISAVKNGKREISCGYEVEYEDNGDGTLKQKNIRGNHVALVDSARAGSKAAIMDSNTRAEEPPERKKKPMSKRNTFLHFFGLAANGRSEDEIRQMAEDAAPMFDEDTAPEKEPEGEPVPETDGDTDYQKRLFESIDAFGGKLDKLLELLAPQREAAEEAAPEGENDPLDEALETIGKEIKGEDAADEDTAEEPGESTDETATEAEEAQVVPAEEMDEKEDQKDGEACGDAEEGASDAAMDAETARSIISALRPAIAAISNEEQRKAVTDAVLSLVKRPAAVSDSAKIAQTVAKNAAMKASKAPKTDIEAIQAIYDSRNPHLNKKGE